MPCCTSRLTPIEITVPELTVREKMWLNKKVHCESRKYKICKEIGDEDVENFRKFYKQYPVFYETIA